MYDAATADHTEEDTVGRHRGSASGDEADQSVPHGKHRRPEGS